MKKQSKADVLRGWGITEPNLIKAGFTWLRYKNPPEKGIYWYWLSRYVRERDVAKYGTCISCGRAITVEGSQAGHFMPADSCGRDLLFDLRNVNAECSHCNAWDDTHLLGYAEGLDERYGEGTAAELRARRILYLNQAKHGVVVKEWKADVYAEKIRALPNYPQLQHADAQT